MLRPLSILASIFGVGASLILWTVPLVVGASAVPALLFPHNSPSLSQTLASVERGAGPTPSLLDAMTQLVGAESEALDIAAVGLQQPVPADLGPRAQHAGSRVVDAVSTYVRSASATLHQVPHV